MKLRDAKIAIVCDWLTSFGGAERVITSLHELFPDAPIYTSLYDEKNFPPLKNAQIVTSFLQKIPGAKKKHQYFLPWMPLVFEAFDLSQYDIVLSSSHSCAKGIITKPDTVHVSYCHSPMRYVWDDYQKYIREYRLNGFFKRWGEKFLHHLRLWDRLAVDRVDYFLTNSQYVKKRIQKYYRADAKVLYPPVDTKKFFLSHAEKRYYLVVGRLTTYKKFDLVVSAFNDLGFPLKVAGTGIEELALKKSAKKNIEFLGQVSDEELSILYANAKALIFPQCEDFGITPLESMASGRPVIAYREGGALETILEDITGLFFHEQNALAISQKVQEFERKKNSFFPQEIRKHAEKFSKEKFQEKILEYLEGLLNK